MIARAHDNPGLLPKTAKIFFDDGDLHIRIQGRTQVEEVATDGCDVILVRVRQDPVELTQ